MPIVAVTGASSPVGRFVVGALATHPGCEAVVEVDGAATGDRIGHGLLSEDIKPALEGTDTLVHVVWIAGDPADVDGATSTANLEITRRALDAAAAAGVTRLVLLSSAAAYGAWNDNAVPLPETAPARPNPGAPFSEAIVAVERLAEEWRDDHPGSTVCLARAALVVGAQPESWMTRELGGLRAIRVRGAARPMQFLHVEDLASALAVLATSDFDGPVNVAPDGWMTAETARALASGPLHLPLPRRIALALTGLPSSYLPFLSEPWVVANYRLKALGWMPFHSNEEALVAGRPATAWQKISPRRRQEAALASAGVALVAMGAGAAALVRRARRRRAQPLFGRSVSLAEAVCRDVSRK